VHPQLVSIAAEFRDAEERLSRLAESLAHELWNVRTDPGRWSVAECVDHLNKTSEAYLPQLRMVIREGGGARTLAQRERRFRRDPVGWLLSVTMPPPVRYIRMKTARPFAPTGLIPPPELVARFRELQQEQVGLLEAADGLPLHRLRILSPFDARLRYNLYSCFVILPRHQHRHLWQAERVAEELSCARPPLPLDPHVT
jgi:hypothetical protein